jgi:hypothetical protein
MERTITIMSNYSDFDWQAVIRARDEHVSNLREDLLNRCNTKGPIDQPFNFPFMLFCSYCDDLRYQVRVRGPEANTIGYMCLDCGFLNENNKPAYRESANNG